MRTIATAFLLALVFVGSAQAQELTVGITGYKPFGIGDLDGKMPVSAELRFTFPESGRIAMEPFVTIGKQERFGNKGFYGFQIRQRLNQSVRNQVFITYGVGGDYARDGLGIPIAGFFGVGLKRQLLTHLAVRPEVQLVTFHVVPIGARVVVGLSVF
jgi:hypothetical protein